MGPRPLLTPRLSLPCPLPSPESCHVPGRLVLWNQMPQGQPCESPIPTPLTIPVQMWWSDPETRKKWRLVRSFKSSLGETGGSTSTSARLVARLQRGSSQLQQEACSGPRRVLEGDPGAAPKEKGAAAESREPGSGCSAVPGRCSPCFPFPAEPLLSAGSCPLWAASLLRASGPSSSSPLGGASRPSLVSWLSPDSPIVEEKMLTRTLHKDWCYNGAKPLATC